MLPCLQNHDLVVFTLKVLPAHLEGYDSEIIRRIGIQGEIDGRSISPERCSSEGWRDHLEKKLFTNGSFISQAKSLLDDMNVEWIAVGADRVGYSPNKYFSSDRFLQTLRLFQQYLNSPDYPSPCIFPKTLHSFLPITDPETKRKVGVLFTHGTGFFSVQFQFHSF